MAERATRYMRAKAKKMYEEDGESFAAIGRAVGFTNMSVSKWAKKEGWVKAGSHAVSTAVAKAEEPEWDTTTGSPSVEAATEWQQDEREGSEAELRERLAALEARNIELEVENAKLNPTVDISLMLEDKVQWLTDNSPEGDRFWLDRAESKFKNDNIKRAKEGLPVFNISDHPEILDDLIVELKTKVAMDRGEPTEPASRKVKLYIHRKGQTPVIEQIPMENQINNMAGSLADGIIRYTRKGFKLTSPFLCPRAGCFKPAASDEFQRWQHDGYCTERHRNEVEGAEKAPTEGIQVQLKDTILSGVN